jgi:hypothetical protein
VGFRLGWLTVGTIAWRNLRHLPAQVSNEDEMVAHIRSRAANMSLDQTQRDAFVKIRRMQTAHLFHAGGGMPLPEALSHDDEELYLSLKASRAKARHELFANKQVGFRRGPVAPSTGRALGAIHTRCCVAGRSLSPTTGSKLMLCDPWLPSSVRKSAPPGSTWRACKVSFAGKLPPSPRFSCLRPCPPPSFRLFGTLKQSGPSSCCTADSGVAPHGPNLRCAR